MLFKPETLVVEDEEPGFEQPGAVRAEGDARFIVGRKKVDLNQLIGELQHNEHVHIPSMGSWSTPAQAMVATMLKRLDL